MTDPITTWDDESIADLISDTMSDTNDMDVRFSDFARATVKALRKEGLLPSVEGAQAVLQAEADKLTELLAARGYPGSHVELWVGRAPNHLGHRVLSYISFDYRSPKPAMEYEHFSAATVMEAIDQARAAIEAIPHPDAFAAWFAWPQSGEAA